MNIAECELSLLTRQTLLLAAWTASRNATPHPVNWQFTTSDARVKLKSIYPNLYSYHFKIQFSTCNNVKFSLISVRNSAQ